MIKSCDLIEDYLFEQAGPDSPGTYLWVTPRGVVHDVDYYDQNRYKLDDPIDHFNALYRIPKLKELLTRSDLKLINDLKYDGSPETIYKKLYAKGWIRLTGYRHQGDYKLSVFMKNKSSSSMRRLRSVLESVGFDEDSSGEVFINMPTNRWGDGIPFSEIFAY